jgi:hypothetical protein
VRKSSPGARRRCVLWWTAGGWQAEPQGSAQFARRGVRRRKTVPSQSFAAKSHAGAWAIPRCSRTPIRICSISLVRKTPVAIARFAAGPEAKLDGCTEPRSTKNDGSKEVEIVRRFRCAVAHEVLRSGDENRHRLRDFLGVLVTGPAGWSWRPALRKSRLPVTSRLPVPNPANFFEHRLEIAYEWPTTRPEHQKNAAPLLATVRRPDISDARFPAMCLAEPVSSNPLHVRTYQVRWWTGINSLMGPDTVSK